MMSEKYPEKIRVRHYVEHHYNAIDEKVYGKGTGLLDELYVDCPVYVPLTPTTERAEEMKDTIRYLLRNLVGSNLGICQGAEDLLDEIEAEEAMLLAGTEGENDV